MKDLSVRIILTKNDQEIILRTQMPYLSQEVQSLKKMHVSLDLFTISKVEVAGEDLDKGSPLYSKIEELFRD